MKILEKFRGGNASHRRKLNDMVDALNRLGNTRGDGLIQVRESGAGVGVGLSVDQLLPRIPKYQATTTPNAFAVLVLKDAGVAGSDVAECTYTYTVKALDDTTILPKNAAGADATAITPETPRLHYVGYWYAGETRTAPAVATSRYGLACYDDDGDIHLLTCFGEIGKDDPCP